MNNTVGSGNDAVGQLKGDSAMNNNFFSFWRRTRRPSGGEKGTIIQEFSNRDPGIDPDVSKKDPGHYVWPFGLVISRLYPEADIRVEYVKYGQKYVEFPYAYDKVCRMSTYRPGEVLRFATDGAQGAIFMSDPVNGDWTPDMFYRRILSYGNGAKMGKRMKNLYKSFPMLMVKLAADRNKPAIVVLPDPPRVSDVDGRSAMTRNMAIRMILENEKMSPRSRGRAIKDIKTGRTTEVSFAGIIPKGWYKDIPKGGMIKGNATIVPNGQLVDPRNPSAKVDILTWRCNVKPELVARDWLMLGAEPSYGAIATKTNDGFLSIWGHVKGMYDWPTLGSTFISYLADIEEAHNKGVDVEDWDEILSIADDDLFSSMKDRFSIYEAFQAARIGLAAVGLDTTCSQLLQYMRWNRVEKMLLGGEENDTTSFNRQKDPRWARGKDGTRNHFYAPWTYSAHIVTREFLEAVGYNLDAYPTGDNVGFYHKETHSFVVSGILFERNLLNLGGLDQDDTVSVHIRLLVDGDGNERLVGIILRNPTDWGEYVIVDMDQDTFGPAFHTSGEIPKVIESDLMPQLTTLVANGSIQYGTMATATISGPRYSLADELRVRTMMTEAGGGTGTVANVKWLYYATYHTHIAYQPATNEQIIDAFQQGISDLASAKVVVDWCNTLRETILANCNGEVDPYWAVRRGGVWVCDVADHDGVGPVGSSRTIRAIMKRENLVLQLKAKMLEEANNKVRLPIGIDPGDFFSVPDEIREEYRNSTTPEGKREAQIKALKSIDYKALKGDMDKIKKDNAYIKASGENNKQARKLFSEVEMMERFSDRQVAHFAKFEAKNGVDFVNKAILQRYVASFALKLHHRAVNWDRWLFSTGSKNDTQPWMYFVRAYLAYMKSQNLDIFTEDDEYDYFTDEVFEDEED